MAISMYQASVPVFIRTLGNLREVLQKGASHAEARKFDPGILVASRLYPDMFPLSRQVQIACDMVKGGAARLAGVEPPKYEDNETTLPELLARIDKTVEYLKTFKAQQIDGSEERPVTLTTQRGTLNFTGQNYLLNFVLPNLYFHATTAYALLRHNGVELGKGDFLGKL
jgi:hypothetical protein